MPLYFFHLTDGNDVLPDEDGLELTDAQAARNEVHAAVHELTRPVNGAGPDGWDGWSVRVVDDTGWQVAQVAMDRSWRVSGETSPAVRELEDQIQHRRERMAALASRTTLLRDAPADGLPLAQKHRTDARAVVPRSMAPRVGRTPPFLRVLPGGRK
jgi:uncharacterized protein DUF6894